MPPNTDQNEPLFLEKEKRNNKIGLHPGPRKYEVYYPAVIFFVYTHLAALYGLYLCCTSAKWPTIFLGYVLYIASGLGVTAGKHRLWTHKAYKAKLPLQIILVVLCSLAGQQSVFTWVKDHRLHHKYSDTDADPHNASRGFFYSHIGWLLVREHEEVTNKGKTLDMSDIRNNPLLRFQERYIYIAIITFCFVLPTMIPMIFWGESFNNAWHVNILRFIFILNVTFFVNSAAHKFGYKPYEKNILPVQNEAVSLFAFGEGFHNYHHTFPWDYRTAELGNNYLNLTTKLIDFFAWVGWAYDLNTAPKDIINERMKRTGDGTDLWGKTTKSFG